MQTLSSLNNTLLSQIDPDLAKAARAARIQTAFAESLMASMETPEAGAFMLEHIQAVYVMKDGAPRKSGKVPIVLRIYSDDSVVRTELDARQEWVRLQLARRGIRYDKMIIHASRYGMRKRRPFARFLENVNEEKGSVSHDVTRHNLTSTEIETLASRVKNPEISAALRCAMDATTAQNTVSSQDGASRRGGVNANPMVEKLETLKRAFCLTFGENAEVVLEKINAAYLTPLTKIDDVPLRLQKNRCVLFSADPRFSTIMDAYDSQIRKCAYRLGLRIYGRITLRTTPEGFDDKRAFPPLSAPIVVSLGANEKHKSEDPQH